MKTELKKLSLFHHKLVTWWLLQKTNVEHLFKANETKTMENCLQLSDKNGASSFESRDREFQIGKSRAETDIDIFQIVKSRAETDIEIFWQKNR